MVQKLFGTTAKGVPIRQKHVDINDVAHFFAFFEALKLHKGKGRGLKRGLQHRIASNENHPVDFTLGSLQNVNMVRFLELRLNDCHILTKQPTWFF
jgi:hypothetical protein